MELTTEEKRIIKGVMRMEKPVMKLASICSMVFSLVLFLSFGIFSFRTGNALSLAYAFLFGLLFYDIVWVRKLHRLIKKIIENKDLINISDFK